MTTTEPRAAQVVIAEIPRGQPLELFSAVCAFFGSAMDGALIGPGNGRSAATVLAQDGLTAGQVAELLRRAAGDREGNDRTPPEPADDEAPSHTVQEMTPTDDGVRISLTPAEVGEGFAKRLMEIYLPLMDEWGADNFLQYEGFHPTTHKRICLTITRPGGKLATEVIAELEAEIDRLRAARGEA